MAVSSALQSAYASLQCCLTVQELAVHVRSVSGPPGETITWSELDNWSMRCARGSWSTTAASRAPIDFDNDGDVAQGLVRFWKVQGGEVVRE